MIFRYQIAGRSYEIELERLGTRCRALIDSEVYEFDILELGPGVISLRQSPASTRPVRLYWAADQATKWISMDGCTYRLEKPAATGVRRSAGGSNDQHVRAPMPAQVRKIEAGEGDIVTEGQPLLILEAMKMEIRISAPLPGKVKRLHVSTGQTVAKDELLAEVEPLIHDQEDEIV